MVPHSQLTFRHRWPTSQFELGYVDERREDRDLRGVLWARCGQNPLNRRGMLTGEPRWLEMHPLRQRECMLRLRCQVCVRPAKTPLGWVFLAPPDWTSPHRTLEITHQPPVCARHIRPSVTFCPALDGHPRVYLVQRAPLYGVEGYLYGYGADGIDVVADTPDFALPYGHTNLTTFLASKLIRRFTDFRLVDLQELVKSLEGAA
ncbi:hypothetical protein [Streptomyces sp. CRN 30]|uniref:hypothetical protein n=1 Tax=Streptomyces sp. CRN 30 TaxID=3075613 RepID=UPI002A82CFA9|nr:hypothetical protein [Streptomyces sp. CRN 30]